jgi:uncharacterized protein YbjT (DUF2867 family)
MKIAFIGASGMLGKPVAKQLIEEGHALTIVARNGSKLREEFPKAMVIKGDVFEYDGVLNAFTTIDAVYLNLSIDQSSKPTDRQTEREGLDNILSIARKTGVKRIVYLSSMVHSYQGMDGFNWWAFDIKKKAVEKIKASGIPYTIFYPSTFMETFPYQAMRGKKIGTIGRSIRPMWFIAAEDYAKQVARSFAKDETGNKEYIVQGPEAYTFDEAAKLMIENYQKEKLGMLRLPLGVAKLIGNFSRKINYAWHICEALNKYPEKFESQTTWDELGKPVMRMSDFAKKL